MSAQCAVAAKQAAGVSMGFFERYLSLWVVLCIVAGILLGQWFPAAFQALGRIEYAQVNLPVGLLIWVMIVPMLMKIDFASISEVKDQKASIGITLFVNWAIKPFTMAALGWLFIRHVFAPWLPAEQLDSYIAGLILLGAAPCTAMVFVWSNLCRGNANFTISQVALNDLVMVFAFAPIVAFLLGVSAIPVPWDTLLLSVVMYIVIPLLIVGVFLVGVIRVFIQPEWIQAIAGTNTLLANLAGVVFGVFMYFPTLVEVPIAKMFLSLGMHPGPLIAYLMADPELSLQSILITSAIIGKLKAWTYVGLVALFSTLAGLTYGAWVDGTSALLLGVAVAAFILLLSSALHVIETRRKA